jgi:hypothetical protein
MAIGLRFAWDRAISARDNVARYHAAPAPMIDRATAIRRELEAVHFIDSTAAMLRPRADLEAELIGIAV